LKRSVTLRIRHLSQRDPQIDPFWLKYKPPLVTVFNKVERACKKIYMNNGLTAPGRRVKLWAPPVGGAHFDGVKEGLHELQREKPTRRWRD